MSKNFLEWSNEISIGVPVIDEQHRRLFIMVNTLYLASTSGENGKAIEDIFEELISDTVFHFKTEEEFFEKCGYPLRKEHVDEHDRLTEKALELQQGLTDGTRTLTFEFMVTLRDWLVDHTTGLDKDFGDYIKENGITFD